MQHYTAREFKDMLGQQKFDNAFKFTFVRNPYDKVLSHYKFRVKTNQTNLGNNPFDFNQWIELTYGKKDPAFYDKPKFFMPQINWLTDQNDQVLVDFIGRFENLQQDFNIVCDYAGMERKTLPHLNKTKKTGSYRDFYNESSREIITEHFRKDLDYFGYEF